MRVTATVTALAAGLFLVTAVPALADNNNNNRNSYNNSGNQDRLVRSAERACRQTAQNRGYDVRDVNGSRYSGNDTTRVNLRLRRKDRTFDARCSYDGRSEKASLDVQGHGDSGSGNRQLLQSAERECRQTAQSKGYDVRDVTGSRATSDRTARVDLRLRRKGDSYDGRCTYDRRDDRASLDVDRSNGNGGNGNSGKGNNGNGNLDKRAKEACWQRAYERNQKLNAFGKLQPDGRDYKVQVGTWQDGTTYQYWCFFDPSTNTADLRPRN
jgi:hypothetical protein